MTFRELRKQVLPYKKLTEFYSEEHGLYLGILYIIFIKGKIFAEKNSTSAFAACYRERRRGGKVSASSTRLF